MKVMKLLGETIGLNLSIARLAVERFFLRKKLLWLVASTHADKRVRRKRKPKRSSHPART